MNMTTDGFQIVVGAGVGVDVHVTESHTHSFSSQNTSAQGGDSIVLRNKGLYLSMLY